MRKTLLSLAVAGIVLASAVPAEARIFGRLLGRRNCNYNCSYDYAGPSWRHPKGCAPCMVVVAQKDTPTQKSSPAQKATQK